MSRPEPFSRSVVTIDRGAPISEAALLMSKRHVGSLIVTEKERPIGLVTDRDLALHGLLEDGQIAEMRVEDCASTPLVTVRMGSSFRELARTLKTNGVRRAVLVDEDGGAVGMLSADDLLRYLGCEVGQLATAVNREFQAEADPCGNSSSVFGKE